MEKELINLTIDDHKNIYLRPLKNNDVSEKYVSWLNDPDVNRYLDVRHSTPESMNDVARFVKNCQANKRPHWGIFLKEQHIGNISCSLYNLLYRWIDISFLIGEKSLWGNGICTNAVASVIDYLFKDQVFHRIQGGACSLNKVSIHMFNKLGFRQEACFRDAALLEGKYVDDLKYGILADEWLHYNFNYIRYKVCNLDWSFFG